jgi:rSAM/selenodomain-associated transferase 2
VRLSVIVPTLNEEATLVAAVEAVRERAVLGPPHEVIVADSGSADGTRAVAARLGVRWVEAHADRAAPPGRAASLNAGARAATGDVLLFLDADTLLPEGWDREIASALDRPEAVGGAFELAFDGTELRLRLVELVDRIRYRISRYYYGDQAVFARADAFRRVGGFPEQPLLESADLCKKLKRVGRLVLVRRRVLTSPRRFRDGGILRVFAHDIRLWLLHRLGRPLERHGERYWEENRRRGRPE